jgi:hypothetical protein
MVPAGWPPMETSKKTLWQVSGYLELEAIVFSEEKSNKFTIRIMSVRIIHRFIELFNSIIYIQQIIARFYGRRVVLRKRFRKKIRRTHEAVSESSRLWPHIQLSPDNVTDVTRTSIGKKYYTK